MNKKVVFLLIKLLFAALIIFIITISCGLVVNSELLHKKNPEFLGFSIAIEHNNNMKPKYKCDDAILIFKNSDYKINENIAFVHNGRHLIGKIEKIENDKYVVGYSNNKITHTITKNDIQGKSLFKIYKFKSIINFFQKE